MLCLCTTQNETPSKRACPIQVLGCFTRAEYSVMYSVTLTRIKLPAHPSVPILGHIR